MKVDIWIIIYTMSNGELCGTEREREGDTGIRTAAQFDHTVGFH